MGENIKKMAQCKDCQAEITWVQSENGRWIPQDIDGTCHFDSCPARRDQRERRKREDRSDYSKIGIDQQQKQLNDYGDH